MRAHSSLVGQACLAIVQALLAAPVVLTAFWLVYAGTDKWRVDRYWDRFPPSFGCNDDKLVDACEARQLWYFWVIPTVAIVAAILLTYQKAKSGAHAGHSAGKVDPIARKSTNLLPPKQFWAWWCGGLTLRDATMVVSWLGINSMWMAFILRRYLSLVPIFAKSSGLPVWVLETELVAVALGSLLFPNFVLLFYPVSRGSIVLQVLGLSYPEAIKYHRWLGHFTMYMVSAHSLGFWGVWLLRGTWLQEALETGARINNLMGGLSFLAGLALWLTSLEAARRRSYDLFYKMHHLGFWGFLLFGCCHYWGMMWYFLPGLLLYAADAVYRVWQAVGDESAAVAAAHTDGGVQPGVVSIRISSSSFAVAPCGFLWLNVPAISFHEWHPFEYIAVTDANHTSSSSSTAAVTGTATATTLGSGAGTAVALLHVKAYNGWTRKLVDLVQHKQQQQQVLLQQQEQGLSPSLQTLSDPWFRVKVEGPYGEVVTPAVPGEGEPLVFVAGGIGATAALSVMAEMEPGQGRERPVLLVWSCRHPGEFTLVGPPLMELAKMKGLELRCHLSYTGDAAELKHYTGTALIQPSPQPPPAGAPAEPACVPQTFNPSPLCPVLVFKTLGAQTVFKLALYGAVLLSALAVLLLVRGYSVVWAAEPWTTAWTGGAYVAGVTVASLVSGLAVLGFGLLVQKVKRRSDTSDRSQTSTAITTGSKEKETGGLKQPLLQTEQLDGPVNGCGKAAAGESGVWAGYTPKLAQISEAEGGMAEGLQLEVSGHQPVAISYGRPDVGEIIRGWLKEQDICREKRVPGGLGETEGDEEVRQGTPAAAARCSGGVAGSAVMKEEEGVVTVGVYAMGPAGLVAATQMICNEINKEQYKGQYKWGLWLKYKQKTHEL